MNSIMKMTLVAIVLLLMTGCWDQTEIEERGFAVGTALDAAENGQITVTLQMALPSQMKGGSGQKDEGGKPYVNLSSTSKTLFKAIRNMSNETSRSPYFQHNQIIVISDELVKTQHIGDILDLFVRDHESRRASKIMVSMGKASEILNVDTAIETLPVSYISSTQNNPDKSESITPATNIGDLHDMLLSEKSYVLPKVEKIEESKVLTTGGAVFNGTNNSFLGFLNEHETTGRNMIQGTVKTASLELEAGDKQFVLEIREFHRLIKVHIDSRGLPVFDVLIAAKGSVGESEFSEEEIMQQLNGEIQLKGEEKIIQLVSQVIMKSQDEFKADFLGFGEKLYQYQYEVWEKYKKNWDVGEHIYSQCSINIEANVQIQSIGTIINSK